MIHIRFIFFFLAASVSIGAYHTNAAAPSSTPDTLSSKALQKLDTLKKRLQQQITHIEQCWHGKEPCSKTDFAILFVTVLTMYTSLKGLLVDLVPYFDQINLYLPENVGWSMTRKVLRKLVDPEDKAPSHRPLWETLYEPFKLNKYNK